VGLKERAVNEAVLRFGGVAPPEIDQRLRDAAAAYADTAQAEKLLNEAHALDPECLPVHFALYKFYFYKTRLADAERAARQALAAAARQAGFPADWTTLVPDTTDWSGGAAHFYLFSLKALAFIRLRCEAGDEARAILAKLAELDPHDSVGASVIRALAAGSEARATPGPAIHPAPAGARSGREDARCTDIYPAVSP
jgi:tetratricopeptide (TPR) repeat protein